MFMVCVAMLFWQLGWRPYATREDNFLSIGLAGCLCVVAGLEIFVVSAISSNSQVANPREVSSGSSNMSSALCSA
jgi:hypothetical protein